MNKRREVLFWSTTLIGIALLSLSLGPLRGAYDDYTVEHYDLKALCFWSSYVFLGTGLVGLIATAVHRGQADKALGSLQTKRKWPVFELTALIGACLSFLALVAMANDRSIDFDIGYRIHSFGLLGVAFGITCSAVLPILFRKDHSGSATKLRRQRVLYGITVVTLLLIGSFLFWGEIERGSTYCQGDSDCGWLDVYGCACARKTSLFWPPFLLRQPPEFAVDCFSYCSCQQNQCKLMPLWLSKGTE